MTESPVANFHGKWIAEDYGRQFVSNLKSNDYLAGACAAAFLFWASAASAADLPSRVAPPVMPPLEAAPYDWTGFYIGVNGGGGIDHFGVPSNGVAGATAFTGFTTILSRGPVLGGQAGYNYELTNLPIIGHAVVGIEVDSDWAGVTGSSTIGTLAGPATFGTRFEDFGTARLRVGYDFGPLLVYVTGGFTYGSFNSFYSVAGFSGSQNVTYARLPPRSQAVGIGAEYALTKNWSAKAEYIYDAVLAQLDTVPSRTPGAVVSFSTRADYSIIRLGLNYKFGLLSPPAPVVAKY